MWNGDEPKPECNCWICRDEEIRLSTFQKFVGITIVTVLVFVYLFIKVL